jgi:chromosome segregation ATPase
MLKLKARNFRRFQEPEPVIFLPGLTIVSGPNGAGKSTLVEGKRSQGVKFISR